jgi:hypothetical protein
MDQSQELIEASKAVYYAVRLALQAILRAKTKEEADAIALAMLKESPEELEL